MASQHSSKSPTAIADTRTAPRGVTSIADFEPFKLLGIACVIMSRTRIRWFGHALPLLSASLAMETFLTSVKF